MTEPDAEQLARDWWRTSIIDMSPGVIRYRGYAIEDLIRARVGYAQMVWLMTRGDLPSPAQAALLEAALMSAVDHGPQAPSIAIARMAATCGVGLNSALASGLNVLGDVHGGAGEQALALYEAVGDRLEAGAGLDEAVREALTEQVAQHGKAIPGFGHRFHPVDPRTAPLLERVDEAVAAGVVSGRHAAIARGIEEALARGRARRIPMNIDGVTAVIYGELGFPAPLARGLFCLSRAVGLLAHAWEQTQQGARIKGPLPRQWTWTYDGAPARGVPAEAGAGPAV
jgi:citrate synthase